MVEVFKTNIDDIDNILRVEYQNNPTNTVAKLFTDLQFYCEVLE